MTSNKGRAVTVICARSGSNRFPDKNVSYLGQRRLLEWAILAAAESDMISNVYVSTDSRGYAEIAERAGATPIMRPPDLATESATSEDTMEHALNCLSDMQVSPQIAVMQQATTPFTKPETINSAVSAVRTGFDTALSIVLADKKPWWAFEMNSDGRLEPFMTLPNDSTYNVEVPPPLYYPTGGVYAFNTDFFRRTHRIYGGRTYGVLVDWYEAIDIDYEHDLEFARWALQYLLSKRSQRSGVHNP